MAGIFGQRPEYNMARKKSQIPLKHQMLSKIAAACKPGKAIPKKRRMCLMCDRMFMSTDGSRICPRCQPIRDARSSYSRPHHKFHGSALDLLEEE